MNLNFLIEVVGDKYELPFILTRARLPGTGILKAPQGYSADLLPGTIIQSGEYAAKYLNALPELAGALRSLYPKSEEGNQDKNQGTNNTGKPTPILSVIIRGKRTARILSS